MTWVYIWLGITAMALIIEFITADLLTIWFAGGGLIAMILAACGLEWYIHLPVFIAVSLTLLLCVRKIALKYFMKGDDKTNADSAIGKEYTLLSEIAFEKLGTIKIGDVVWNVKTKDERQTVAQGSIVKVVGVEGNKYVVEYVPDEN